VGIGVDAGAPNEFWGELGMLSVGSELRAPVLVVGVAGLAMAGLV
jgi:hypothetical protein